MTNIAKLLQVPIGCGQDARVSAFENPDARKSQVLNGHVDNCNRAKGQGRRATQAWLTASKRSSNTKASRDYTEESPHPY